MTSPILNTNSKSLKLYKNSLPTFTQQQINILIGTLLGDASLVLRPGVSGCRIQFSQKIANESYILDLYKVFKAFCGTEPKEATASKSGFAGGTNTIYFRTYSIKQLLFYHKLFYIKNTCTDPQYLEKLEAGYIAKSKYMKIVPPSIEEYLNAEVLAYWYMDDGSFDRIKGVCKISTHGFSLSENELLADCLKKLFNLDVRVHKDRKYYKLYIIKADTVSFIELIKPYMKLPLFNYKVGE